MLQINYFNMCSGVFYAYLRSISNILHNFKIKKIFFFTAITCLMLSCSQEAEVSEPDLKEPAFKKLKPTGALTKFVSRAGYAELYVSNGDLWMAAAPDYEWNKITKPSDGTISDIAISGDSLYAIVINNKTGETTIWCSDRSGDGSWDRVKNGTKEQYRAIFSANGVLFISEWNGNYYFNDKNYNIITLSGNFVKYNTSLLTGVVWMNSNYFFATQGDGIYYSPMPNKSTTRSLPVTNKNILGLVKLPASKIAAVSKKGYIYQINVPALVHGQEFDHQTNVSIPTITESKDFQISFTKALAYYQNSDAGLLIVGIKSNFTKEVGYRELFVNYNTGNITFELRYPGELSYTSVSDRETYTASIGEKKLNAVIQAGPNTERLPLMFASTQKDGLWSFRSNSEGRKIWKAEN
ncbi:MAG: hypothetical protein LBD07_03345 [Spirochaetaceae bacterium]|jgi:hypothetical protein|nr:hypothetical protein [Spirochaetaceae bacterium]